MSIEDHFNEHVLQIWRQHLTEPALMPTQYPAGHFKQDLKLLMLGMNPAYSEASIQNRLDLLKIALRAHDVFGWRPDTVPQYRDELLAVEKHAFKHYRVFFGPQEKFAQRVGCADSYSHFDLFHWRQTKQNEFLQVVGMPASLNAFGKAQVALTRETIMAIRPKVVVIANATASKRAVEYLPLEYVGNSRTQCILPGLPGTRFFLAGMISGMRSMDIFSLIRLEDDVRGYLKEHEMLSNR